jgi:hypothetical protein
MDCMVGGAILESEEECLGKVIEMMIKEGVSADEITTQTRGWAKEVFEVSFFSKGFA